MSEDLVSYIGHGAYVLIFFSFLVHKMLWLRFLAIFAGVCSIFYNAHVAAEPIWVPIQWNCVFIVTNLFHIVKIYRDKMQVNFESDLRSVYESRFKNFAPMEFKNLLDLGFVRTVPAGTVLVEEDNELDAVIFIIHGVCDVVVKDNVVAQLSTNDFVGEMSFLTGEQTSACVRCETQVKYIFWEKTKLMKKLYSNPHLLHRFEGAIGLQLIEKLKQETKKRTELESAA